MNCMLDRYNNEIENLIKWYERCKNAAIRAESLDPNGAAFLQPLHEQRYSYDHFIRAIAYEAENESDECVKKALSSAIAHLQRSYSDTVEWILVSVIEEYTSALKPFSSEQINRGFPEYYVTIRPDLLRISKLVDEFKIAKSVEKASTVIVDDNTDSMANQFLSHEVIDKTLQYYNELKSHEQTLIEIKDEESRKHRNELIIKDLLIPVIVGVIVGIVSGVIVSLIVN